MFILNPKKVSSVPGSEVFTVVEAAEISLEIQASKPTFGVAYQLTDPSNPELSWVFL